MIIVINLIKILENAYLKYEINMKCTSNLSIYAIIRKKKPQTQKLEVKKPLEWKKFKKHT